MYEKTVLVYHISNTLNVSYKIIKYLQRYVFRELKLLKVVTAKACHLFALNAVQSVMPNLRCNSKQH
jgi:hypothetical protein